MLKVMTNIGTESVIEGMANMPAEHGFDAITPIDYLINNTSSRAGNFILAAAHGPRARPVNWDAPATGDERI
jgi:hypothetical protein